MEKDRIDYLSDNFENPHRLLMKEGYKLANKELQKLQAPEGKDIWGCGQENYQSFLCQVKELKEIEMACNYIDKCFR